MANTSPATVTVTGSTGPGQAVSSLKFTDVVDLEVNFNSQTLKITRAGSGGIVYFDYSALSTITWTITAGLTTAAFS
jgi:hypothetical protein